MRLTSQDNGLIAEVFPNLSMDPTKPNYVQVIVDDPDKGSRLVRLVQDTDLASTTAAPNNMPAAGTFGPLTGGDDGLGGLADADFVGSPAGKIPTESERPRRVVPE